MPAVRTFSELRLVNGSTGDPVLFVDYPGEDGAFLFDAGELGGLDMGRLGNLAAVFLTHHHMDHFVGFDRILRANLNRDKTLHVFGPEATIPRVYDRIKSYEIQCFPFQKIVLEVHELLPGRERSARLECCRHFPEPETTERAWAGPVVYEKGDVAVEATATDHTVPGLAYALVDRALGARVAFVTDTAWSHAVRPALVRLADRAYRLYCDSYYSIEQAGRAEEYRHMTATYAGELAAQARVEQLVLMHFGPRYAGHYEALVEEARAIFPRVSADLSFARP
jgi:ribonuclease BN (tRNA processing enzyme)